MAVTVEIRPRIRRQRDLCPMRCPDIGRLQREGRTSRGDDPNRRIRPTSCVEGEVSRLVDAPVDSVTVTFEIPHDRKPFDARVNPDTKVLQWILDRLRLGTGTQAEAHDEKPSHTRTLRCPAENANRQHERLNIASTGRSKRICSRSQRGPSRADVVHEQKTW